MNLLLGMKLIGVFNKSKARFKRECEEEGVAASDPLADPMGAIITVAIAMGVVDVDQASSIAATYGSRHTTKNVAKIRNDALALKPAAEHARNQSWDEAYKEVRKAGVDGPGSHIHFGMILEDELNKAGIDWRELHWSTIFGGDDD